MERRCPYCGAELPPPESDETPSVECPTCHNIVRPPNPHARRFAWVALLTAVLYFIAMFSMIVGDTSRWIFLIFGLATASGVYLIYVMYHFFRAGA